MVDVRLQGTRTRNLTWLEEIEWQHQMEHQRVGDGAPNEASCQIALLHHVGPDWVPLSVGAPAEGVGHAVAVPLCGRHISATPCGRSGVQ